MCDIPITKCNTGYVYMLIYFNGMNFTYIGKTHSIRTTIRQNNSVVGDIDTETIHLRPYAPF